VEVTAALLADAAQVQGGKLYLLGGGFDTIRTRNVPAVHKALCVVLVIEVGPDERHTDLDIRVTLYDEDMSPTGAEAQGTLRVGAPPTLRPGQASLIPLVIPFSDLPLPSAKGYAFVVAQADRELVRIPLWVVIA